jgi:hypothetical protein
MDRVMADRRLPMLLIAMLLLAACGRSLTDSPGPSARRDAIPTATPIAIATPNPTLIATATPTPTPPATPAPIWAAWRQAPSQRSVSDVHFQDVVWTGTRFVAAANALDGGSVFLDSNDGVIWHRQAKNGSAVASIRLAAGPHGVVAVGSMTSWVSTDGLTWTTRRNAFPKPALAGDDIAVTDVVARGDGWLAVGRRDKACQIDCGLTPIRAYVWTSADGSHWTRVADQTSLKGGGMVGVNHGNPGLIAVGVAAGHAAIWTSPDGLAWSRVPDASMFRAPKAAGDLPFAATDVASRDGVTVVVGNALGQDTCLPGTAVPSCPGARAWLSANGTAWSKAAVAKAKDGQMFSVTLTPQGFLAVGPSGGCLGGMWSSTDGRSWRCDASDSRFKGFGPYAAAASDAVVVAVGLTDQGTNDSGAYRGAAWSRTLQ